VVTKYTAFAESTAQKYNFILESKSRWIIQSSERQRNPRIIDE